jgi:DNA (cytosine-5)-methyltransferase 1
VQEVKQQEASAMRYASVCDGIGAVHVAWRSLGWKCVWTSEIEPFPAAVVEQRHGLPNLGDMTAITEEMLDEYGAVDLLVGGTPCQSFSVAGLRGGLADPRGNLALRFVQLAAVMQPRWIVWENVPGVLSSGGGRDFGTFLGALAELGYGFAYRVLDAQWFGVAQRRRRVFVVGYLGDWRRAAAVLFERESVFGNPPTRRKAWEGIARSTAASLTSSGRGIERPGESRGQDDVVLSPMWRAGECANAESYSDHAGTLVTHRSQKGGIVAFHPTQDPISSVDGSTHAMGCGSKGGCSTQAVAFTQNTRDEVRKIGGDGDICGALAAEAGMKQQNYVAVPFDTTQITSKSNYSSPKAGDPCHPIAAGDHAPAVASCEVSSSLRANPGSGWRSNGTPVEGVAMTAMSVRRLTPTECERLQGFPDGYTLVTYRGKPAADGPRYRALGNSMAVPVMRWIGERIAAVDALPMDGKASA